MAALSQPPAERARKALSLALQAMQPAGKQGALAAAMGVSESTVSRIKSEKLEDAIVLVSHLGFKLVPADFKCVSSEAYEFLTKTHARVMAQAPELIWDTEE